MRNNFNHSFMRDCNKIEDRVGDAVLPIPENPNYEHINVTEGRLVF